MRKVYICSPYRAKDGAELDRNIDYAQQLTRQALEAGLAPITPHLYITCGIYVASCSTISPSPLTSLGTVSITLGAIFPTTVTILSTRLLVSCEKFASLSAIPATQLSHAELIELTEPSIVVLASFAVVPVMPISVCTT